jgi:hypothetical protein
MSRSNYSDECEHVGLWRGAVLALWLVCVVVFVVGGKPEWVLGCSRVVASSPARGPQQESYNYEPSRTRTESLLYRYLPLAVLALLVQLFGWGLLLRDGDLERLFGVLLIGIGVVCLGSVLGKWAFGSAWYFWSLRWLW